jgi:hypothetical protein
MVAAHSSRPDGRSPIPSYRQRRSASCWPTGPISSAAAVAEDY